MSDLGSLTAYAHTHQGHLLALPFDLDARLTAWSSLRRKMIHDLPDAFTRDEWAYLISFLDPETLKQPFLRSFGTRIEAPDEAALWTALASLPALRLLRPRGTVAVWLPNNVSLLGPLTMILLSLTGNRLLLKGGTQSEDLTGAFLDFLRTHTDSDALGGWLADSVTYERFHRDDPRNKAWAAEANIRIIFGSDQAAKAIEALPHPLESQGFCFSDRCSEAWIDPDFVDEQGLIDLLKVFAIYGQAGCTSPRRVILLNATEAQAHDLQQRLLTLWPQVIKRQPAMHIASANVMSAQLGKALGWKTALTHQHAAVLAVGDLSLPPFEGPMTLPILPTSFEQATATLPENIQTIGHAVASPLSERWTRLLANHAIKRLVPLRQMHHFSELWDGWRFWQSCFEEVEFTP